MNLVHSMTGPAAMGAMTASLTNGALAKADSVSYLVNVTLRPGFVGAGADAASIYGYDVCDMIAAGGPSDHIFDKFPSDFDTSDRYQVSYLVTQAANELCPKQIWQLRHSASAAPAASL